MIAVVSHSGFLGRGISGTLFDNADYRVFDFAGDESDQLTEWDSTKDKGGGMGRSRRSSL